MIASNPAFYKGGISQSPSVRTTSAGILTFAALVSSPLFGLNTLLSYVIVFLNCGTPQHMTIKIRVGVIEMGAKNDPNYPLRPESATVDEPFREPVAKQRSSPGRSAT